MDHASLVRAFGVEFDETQLEKVNADPKRQFKWPTPTLPDGAVRDY